MRTARDFLTGLIDYAGLFPPARLRMDDAVREFARYSSSSDRDLLGRFILPASRLNEFSDAAKPFADERRDSWRLSAIVSAGNNSEIEAIDQFNDANTRDRIVVDTIEIPIADPKDIEWARRSFGKGFSLFFEPSSLENSGQLLELIARSGASAKLRTGGVVATAIPPATSVLRFIQTCAALSLPFKATAGLHHALRGEYALTYENEAPHGTMFGYLNIFLVAAFHRAGLPESALFDLLEESDPTSITFDESGVWWRGNLADEAHLTATRKSVAVSFGSCSFTEPVDEAKSMHLI